MELKETLAWAAGYMEEHGTFYIDKPTSEFQYSARTYQNVAALQRFASLFELDVLDAAKSRKGPAKRIKVAEAQLRELLKDVWPYLTNDRRRYLVEMLKMARALREARNSDLSKPE